MERPSESISFGKYELLEKIAIGGMAEVFRARLRGEGGFEKHLAIKRILPHLSSDTEFVMMLIDEAKIAVSLAHPNIVQIYDLGKIDGTYFIAMEFIEGGDLKAVLRRCAERNVRVPIAHAVYITCELLKGLEYAHGKTHGPKDSPRPLHIIHRDISPPNILISYEGEVKIVDFGIAKANTRMMETSAGILKGKFEYMSPEQASGLALDHRTDLFSTALLLYEMVTGHNAFAGEADIQVLQNVRAARFTPPSRLVPDLHRRLEQILMRALARDPEDRFARAGELRSELTSFAFEAGAISSASKLAAFMRDLFAPEVQSGKTVSSASPIFVRPEAARQAAAGASPGYDPRSDQPIAAAPLPPSVVSTQPMTAPLPAQPLPVSAVSTQPLPGPALVQGPRSIETRIVPSTADDSPTIAGTTVRGMDALLNLDNPRTGPRPTGATGQLPSAEVLQDVLERSESLGDSLPGGFPGRAGDSPVAFSFFANPGAAPDGRPVPLQYGFEDDEVATTVQQVEAIGPRDVRAPLTNQGGRVTRLPVPGRTDDHGGEMELELDESLRSPVGSPGANVPPTGAASAPNREMQRPPTSLPPPDPPTRLLNDNAASSTPGPMDNNARTSGPRPVYGSWPNSDPAAGRADFSGRAGGPGAGRKTPDLPGGTELDRPFYLSESVSQGARAADRPLYPSREASAFGGRGGPPPYSEPETGGLELHGSELTSLNAPETAGFAGHGTEFPPFGAETSSFAGRGTDFPSFASEGSSVPVRGTELPPFEPAASGFQARGTELPSFARGGSGLPGRQMTETTPAHPTEPLRFDPLPSGPISAPGAVSDPFGRGRAAALPGSTLGQTRRDPGLTFGQPTSALPASPLSRLIARPIVFGVGLIVGALLGLWIGAATTPEAPAGTTRSLAEQTAAETAKLIIQAENGVETYLNSNPAGSSYPLILNLAPQRVNQIRLAKPGFRDYEIPVKLEPAQSMILAVPALVPVSSATATTEPTPEPQEDP